MTRYPPFYYTKIPLHGQLEYDGTAIWPGQVCYQGEIATFHFHLPDAQAGAKLSFLVKKVKEATNLLWQSDLSKDVPVGMYIAMIPYTVTSLMVPGTYYFAVTEKMGIGAVATVLEGTFNIELTVASPNPRIAITDGEITASGDSHSQLSTITTERTVPVTPDIGRT